MLNYLSQRDSMSQLTPKGLSIEPGPKHSHAHQKLLNIQTLVSRDSLLMAR